MVDSVQDFQGRVPTDAAPPTRSFVRSGAATLLHVGLLDTNVVRTSSVETNTLKVTEDIETDTLTAVDIKTDTIEVKCSHGGTKPVVLELIPATLEVVSNSSRRFGSLVILEFTLKVLLVPLPVNEIEVFIFGDDNDAPASGTVAISGWANSTAAFFGFEAGVRSTISTGVFLKPGVVVPVGTELSFTGAYFAVGVT